MEYKGQYLECVDNFWYPALEIGGLYKIVDIDFEDWEVEIEISGYPDYPIRLFKGDALTGDSWVVTKIDNQLKEKRMDVRSLEREIEELYQEIEALEREKEILLG